MTGKELLIDELSKKGLTNAQIHSKAVDAVIDIFSERAELVDEIAKERIDEARKICADRELLLESAKKEMERARMERAYAKRDMDYASAERQQAQEEIAELEEELARQKAAILELETSESRDRFRLAMYYQDAVEIETPQNRTAYLAGLAAILSGTNVTMGIEKAWIEQEKQHKLVTVKDELRRSTD